MNGTGSLRRPLQRAKHHEAERQAPYGDAEAQVLAYALFTEALNPKDTLSAVTLDAASGKLLSRRDISGPAADWFGLYFGEATRVLPWDPMSARFVFVDSTLTKDGASASVGATTVYTIDPSTGESTGHLVSGCAGYPLGMAWDAGLGALVVGTHGDSTASFCAIDPDTGAGKPLGTVKRGSDETSTDYYAAYISHAHAGTAYRVGNQHVSSGEGAGVGVIALPGTEDVTSGTWTIAPDASHGMPVTVQRHPSGGFVSLAPRSSGLLDVVSWDIGSGAEVVAELANARQPVIPMTNSPLGYVGDSVSGDTFASMTVHVVPNLVDPGLNDRWTVSVVSLSTGAVVESALDPQPSVLGAETVSLAGFGLPASPSIVA